MTTEQTTDSGNGISYGFLTSPWHMFLYLWALMLFMDFDWKLGTGWLLWRLGHNARMAWERREEQRKQAKSLLPAQ